MENIKIYSTEDINALGAQYITGALFFSRRLFHWELNFKGGGMSGRVPYEVVQLYNTTTLSLLGLAHV